MGQLCQPMMNDSEALKSMGSRHTLYDLDFSNNGARVRLILYKKKINKKEVDVVSPMEIGGWKSPEYLALNPQGKMPLLIVNDGSTNGMTVPESDTICRYLLTKYNEGPSFLPDDTKSNLIARLHDMYITTIQSCLYIETPPFGVYGTREKAIAELQTQFKIIDDLVDDDRNGLYITGSEVSLADTALFPTLVIYKFMEPLFGSLAQPLPSKLDKWFEGLKDGDKDFSKVYTEIYSGLEWWQSNGMWDNSTWLAAMLDDNKDSSTDFDKIISGKTKASIVKDDEEVLAFKDINPAAPAHVLVIPKKKKGLTSLREATSDHVELLGKLMLAAGEIAKDTNLGFGDGARIVVNDGKDAGQEVPHIHVHVLGGQNFTWPPV